MDIRINNVNSRQLILVSKQPNLLHHLQFMIINQKGMKTVMIQMRMILVHLQKTTLVKRVWPLPFLRRRMMKNSTSKKKSNQNLMIYSKRKKSPSLMKIKLTLRWRRKKINSKKRKKKKLLLRNLQLFDRKIINSSNRQLFLNSSISKSSNSSKYRSSNRKFVSSKGSKCLRLL